jgi:phospholipid-binding lipoprotein MlaA
MKMPFKSRICAWLLVALAGALQACATVANPDPRDPLESFNRGVFGFNDALDGAVVKPVATVYRDILPAQVRKGVGNFFNNLEDVWSIVNNALQLRGADTGDSIARVMVNSTLGILGFADVASDFNVERHTANFGLTLARWGVQPGPYVVLPLLGPSTLRDTVAFPVDLACDPLNGVQDSPTRYGMKAVSVVDIRAKYLSAGDIVEGAALDKYSFMRDAYLQRRRYQVYDGNPPDEEAEPAR